LVLHTATAKHPAHTTTAKELREQIFCGHAAAHTSIAVQSFLTILVVDLALLSV
jgi:hypothetical protein